MKEQTWEEGLEIAPELVDLSTEISPLAADGDESDNLAPKSKSHLTELRRRIEERLDSKRIDHEYDWDDFDDLSESFQ